MQTPEQIVDAALAHGDRRSPEYRRGMLDVIKYRMQGVRIQVPFQLGTSQADAYFAGNDRGHALWRSIQGEEVSTLPRKGGNRRNPGFHPAKAQV